MLRDLVHEQVVAHLAQCVFSAPAPDTPIQWLCPDLVEGPQLARLLLSPRIKEVRNASPYKLHAGISARGRCHGYLDIPAQTESGVPGAWSRDQRDRQTDRVPFIIILFNHCPIFSSPPALNFSARQYDLCDTW